MKSNWGMGSNNTRELDRELEVNPRSTREGYRDCLASR